MRPLGARLAMLAGPLQLVALRDTTDAMIRGLIR